MANTYTLLETITVGAAGASSVTFNSIPQTGYTDLVIKYSGRSSIADVLGLITLNGSAVSYSGKRLYGTGSAAVSNAGSTTSFNPPSIVASTFTANTFGNGEIYIPNFTSSNYKSVSIDAVTENNATESYTTLYAGLWSNTAAVTSVSLAANGGSWMQHSTFSLYGVSALGVTPTKAPKATGGSIIQTDGTYWYHAFLSSGTFTPATALTCDVLVVAGGGGGGSRGSSLGGEGGGGAGGLLHFASQSIGASAQTITIGAGGTAPTTARGNNGNDSQFAALTLVKGGGGGANRTLNTGLNGGSGGGGSFNGGAGGSATSGQGFAGGSGSTTTGNAAGGGGAGAAAANSTTNPTNGGDGLNTYSSWATTTGTGVSGYYAGGGGGYGVSGSGNGGAGGGGNGNGFAGTANTGGGGGGGNVNGGAGGSGIVIVRYLA